MCTHVCLCVCVCVCVVYSKMNTNRVVPPLTDVYNFNAYNESMVPAPDVKESESEVQ